MTTVSELRKQLEGLEEDMPIGIILQKDNSHFLFGIDPREDIHITSLPDIKLHISTGSMFCGYFLNESPKDDPPTTAHIHSF
jgi:hypothetical protein